MMSEGVGYRIAALRCELCGLERPAGELEPLAGLQICACCRGGDHERVLRRWGLELRKKHTPAARNSGASIFVEVKRPTFLEIFAKFDRELKQGWLRRLLGGQDPQVGDPTFDAQIAIAPGEGFDGATLRLLERPGVRQALAALVGLGCSVELAGRTVYAHDRDAGAFDTLADLDEAALLTLALAVHVERYAQSGAV